MNDNLSALKQNLSVQRVLPPILPDFHFSHPMPHQASLQSFSSLSVILSSYLGSESIVCNYSILTQFISEKPVTPKPLKANHQKSDVQQDTGGTNMNSSHSCISCIHLFWYIFLSTTARRQEERTCQKSTYAPPVFRSVNVLSHRYNYSRSPRKLLYRHV